MSMNGRNTSNTPAKKQSPKFRKADFAIRRSNVDTFSQIDSFNVTAKQEAVAKQQVPVPPMQYQQYGANQTYYPGFLPTQSMNHGNFNGNLGNVPNMSHQAQMGGVGQPGPVPSGPGFQMQHNTNPSGIIQNPGMTMTPQQGSFFGNVPGVMSSGIPSGMPQQASLNTFQDSTTNSQPVTDDVFGDFSSFGAPAPASQASVPSLSDNSSCNGLTSLPKQGTSTAFGLKPGKQPVDDEDDFGDFGTFDGPTSVSFAPSAEDLQMAANFQTSKVLSAENQSTPAIFDASFSGTGSDDDFGDFSSFNVSPSVGVNKPQELTQSMPDPLIICEPRVPAVAQTGQRVNVVVKKKFNSSSQSGTFSSHQTQPRKITPPKGAGNAVFADALAKASNHLAGTGRPPSIEDEDFKTLQEVVQAPDLSRGSPIVTQIGAFTLPDTPTRINKIFPKCPPKPTADDEDGFGEFAAVPQFTPQPTTTSSAGAINHDSSIEPENSQTSIDLKHDKHTASEIRSHAVDWSSLKALNELRETEQSEGDLGDFSVFGGQSLRPSTEAPPVGSSLLTSPQHNVTQNREGKSVEDVEDEWSDFGEVKPVNDAAPPSSLWSSVSTEDQSWSAFSTAQTPQKHSSQAEYVEDDFQSFSSVPDISNQRTSQQTEELGQSEVITSTNQNQQPSLFDMKDSEADNDSDWSDFASRPKFHEDAVSSDWSFKDNGSLHGTSTEVEPGQNKDLFAADTISRLSLDEKKPPNSIGQSNLFGGSGSNSDWSMPEIAPPPVVDEWAAFDSANPARGEKSGEQSSTMSKTGTWPSFDDSRCANEKIQANNGGSKVDWNIPENSANVTNDEDEWSNFDSMQPKATAAATVSETPAEGDEDLSGSFAKQTCEEQSSIFPAREKSRTSEDEDYGGPPPLTSPQSAGVDKLSSVFGAFGSPTGEFPTFPQTPEDKAATEEWSAFGNVTKSSIDEQLNKSSEHNDPSTPALTGAIDNFDPSSSDPQNEWGDFGTVRTENSEVKTSYPIAVKTENQEKSLKRSISPTASLSPTGPPPLTEEDFSPTKPSSVQADWFSFRESSEEQELPAMSNSEFFAMDSVVQQNSTEDSSMELVVEIDRPLSVCSQLSQPSDTIQEEVSLPPFDGITEDTPNDDQSVNTMPLEGTQLHKLGDSADCIGPSAPKTDCDWGNLPMDNQPLDQQTTEWGSIQQPSPDVLSLKSSSEKSENQDSQENPRNSIEYQSDMPVDSDSIESLPEESLPVNKANDEWEFKSEAPNPDNQCTDITDDGDDDWGFQSVPSNQPEAITPEDEIKIDDNDEWGFQSAPEASQGVVDNDDWGFQSSDQQTDTIECDGESTGGDEGSGGFQSAGERNENKDDNNWGFPSNDKELSEPVGDENDWSGFDSRTDPFPADNNEDDWGFKSVPAAGASCEKDGDWTFKEAAEDENEFQGFSSPPVDTPTQSGKISGSKILQLLKNTFEESPIPAKSSARETILSDSLGENKLWDSLIDLNKNSSLQLRWMDSDCHKKLISSLHIPLQPRGTAGILQPSRGLLTPSQILTPTPSMSKPPQRVVIQQNSKSSRIVTVSSKPNTEPQGVKTEENLLDLDFFES